MDMDISMKNVMEIDSFCGHCLKMIKLEFTCSDNDDIDGDSKKIVFSVELKFSIKSLKNRSHAHTHFI